MAEAHPIAKLARQYAVDYQRAPATLYDYLRRWCKNSGQRKPYRLTRRTARHILSRKFK